MSLYNNDKRKIRMLLWGAGTYLKDIIDDIDGNSVNSLDY